MSSVVELNPTIAKEILKNASMKGISVEVYLRKIVESDEDARITLMREAINDKLFMADLNETMNDFSQTDFEK